MWGHDLGWWGFWASIGAMILTIPLNILANFLTPKLRVWWRIRSLGSATKKLNELLELAETMGKLPVMGHSETLILQGIRTLVWIVMLMAYSILLTVIFSAQVDIVTKPMHFRKEYLALFIVMVFFQATVGSIGLARINRLLETSVYENFG